MATDYIVQQGDYLSKIAKDYGFSDYRTIWHHPNNAALKSKRKNPNVLFPGDHLFIPDRELREESRNTDKRHRFQKRGPTLKLRLVLEDMYEKPIANAPCIIALENQFLKVTTDAKGRIVQDIPQDAQNATLIIQDTAQTPFSFMEIPLKIGHLDPVEELSGQRGRLSNMGYFPGDSEDQEDARFRFAVEQFQADHHLRVDGICGPKTQAKLKEVHGC
jgi:N-acetylmuramoyl-L-alanine amidase